MAALVIATGVVAFTTWSLWLADAQEARGSTMAMKALADAQSKLRCAQLFLCDFSLQVTKPWQNHAKTHGQRLDRMSYWQKFSRSYVDDSFTLLVMWQSLPRPHGACRFLYATKIYI